MRRSIIFALLSVTALTTNTKQNNRGFIRGVVGTAAAAALALYAAQPHIKNAVDTYTLNSNIRSDPRFAESVFDTEMKKTPYFTTSYSEDVSKLNRLQYPSPTSARSVSEFCESYASCTQSYDLPQYYHGVLGNKHDIARRLVRAIELYGNEAAQDLVGFAQLIEPKEGPLINGAERDQVLLLIQNFEFQLARHDNDATISAWQALNEALIAWQAASVLIK